MNCEEFEHVIRAAAQVDVFPHSDPARADQIDGAIAEMARASIKPSPTTPTVSVRKRSLRLPDGRLDWYRLRYVWLRGEIRP